MPDILTLNGQMLVSPDGKPLLAPPTENVTAGVIYTTATEYGCPITAIVRTTGITVPNDVLVNQDNLTTVVIEGSPTLISVRAFKECINLKQVTIPASVTRIGTEAFYNCTSLENVYFKGTQAQWQGISIGTNNTPLTNATIHYEWTGE